MSESALQLVDARQAPAPTAAAIPPTGVPASGAALHAGPVALRSLDDIVQLAGAFARSGLFNDVREASHAVVKILAGAELGMSPMASMNGVYIVKGRVSLGAGLIAAAIKRSGRYDFRVRTHTDALCEIEFFEVDARTGHKDPLGTASFSAADAKRAGTQNMGKFPRNMLYARALTNGARWHTPDVFGGPVYTPDELGARVNEEGEPLEPAEVVEDDPSPARRQLDRMGRHPSETLYGGPTDDEAREAAEAKRQRPARREPAPAPLLEAAEDAVEVLDLTPDELATTCAERLDLVDTADGDTLRRWYDEARAWPAPYGPRLGAAIAAEGRRRTNA